jgi:hypothetical protein
MSKPIHSYVAILLMSFLLAALSACGQRTPATAEETSHHSSLITHHSPSTTHHSPLATHQTDEQFPFPADREGRLLAEKLRPSDQVPPLTEEKKTGPKRQSGPAKLENPDVPLAAATLNPPASVPLEKGGGKPILPKLVEAESLLLRQRIEMDQPTAMKLPASPKVAWPSPDINEPIRLPILARPVVDRASLDDPSGDASQSAALVSTVPDRTIPAPFLRLNLPDPFEHRNTVRLRVAPELELGSIPTDLIRVPMR